MKVIKWKRTIKRVNFGIQELEVRTEKGVFDELNDEFGFTLNPCCSKGINKCNRWFTGEEGLFQNWSNEIVYLYPPYKNISVWLRKAYESSQNGATVVCLIPSRTETRWYHEYAMRGEIRLIKGRLKFEGYENGSPFPSAIVIFRPPENIDRLAA